MFITPAWEKKRLIIPDDRPLISLLESTPAWSSAPFNTPECVDTRPDNPKSPDYIYAKRLHCDWDNSIDPRPDCWNKWIIYNDAFGFPWHSAELPFRVGNCLARVLLSVGFNGKPEVKAVQFEGVLSRYNTANSWIIHKFVLPLHVCCCCLINMDTATLVHGRCVVRLHKLELLQDSPLYSGRFKVPRH